MLEFQYYLVRYLSGTFSCSEFMNVYYCSSPVTLGVAYLDCVTAYSSFCSSIYTQTKPAVHTAQNAFYEDAGKAGFLSVHHYYSNHNVHRGSRLL